MYSEMARRRWPSPSGTIRSRHSLSIESTNRSAKAFRFGLIGGNRTAFFFAISLRYQRSIVSGVAMVATASRRRKAR